MAEPDRTREIETDPSAEIEAMGVIANAFAKLGTGSRARVLDWAYRFYLQSGSNARESTVGSVRNVAEAHPIATNAPAETMDIATLFARSNPGTEGEKALVAGYFFQRLQGMEDFDSFTLNSELKHLGHGVTNITRALGSLIGVKPQLVMQTRKEGKSKQARKRYKLTLEGQKRVERMLHDQGNLE
ncbi:MAG: hypothetical protein AB7G12_13790 [Thermoanaerobaculia bacterium]